jgi:multiple sugar transport system permease protein
MMRKAAVYVLLTLGLGVVVTPFGWALLSSFKTEPEIRRNPPTFLPHKATLGAYRELADRLDLFTVFANSVIVAVIVVLANLLFCSMVAYALTKLAFRARGTVFTLIMLQMMVPPVVLVVPQFVLVANLGMVNTIFGIVLPYLVMPLGIFLMRQFMADIPDDLVHAARIDGAGEFRIFFRIVLPLCKPPLATLGLITFLAAWNNFLWPAVVAQSQDKYTLPVALAIFANHEATHYGLLLAGAVVVVTPIIVLFLALQRFFVEGIAQTGIK